MTTQAEVDKLLLTAEKAFMAVRAVNAELDKGLGPKGQRYIGKSFGARRIKWWRIGTEAVEKLSRKLKRLGIQHETADNFRLLGNKPVTLIIWVPEDFLPSQYPALSRAQAAKPSRVPFDTPHPAMVSSRIRGTDSFIPPPLPDTVTVPKALWDKVVKAVSSGDDRKCVAAMAAIGRFERG